MSGEAARKIKIAPAPISSRFFCPRPPSSLSNQNRHATQASSRLTSLTVAEDASRNHVPQPRFQSTISYQTDGKIPRSQGFYSPCRGLFLESPGVSVLGIPIPKSLAFWRFGHPLLILLQRFRHSPVLSRDAQIPSVVIPSKKTLDFAGKSKTF